MNKVVSVILGLLILIGSGALLFNMAKGLAFNDPRGILLYFGMIAATGLSYTVIHQERYPVKVVSIVYISTILLLIMFGRDSSGTIIANSILLLSVPSLLFILLGSRLGKAITFILSPIQKYCQKIGLKLSTHVIAGIIGFTIACAWLSV